MVGAELGGPWLVKDAEEEKGHGSSLGMESLISQGLE